MKLSNSITAFILTALITLYSLYARSQTSAGWAVILVDFCVLLFYFGHLTYALLLHLVDA